LLVDSSGGKWYVGLAGRFVDVDQGLEPDQGSIHFNNVIDVKSVGIGVNIDYDNRDMPLNTYDGRLFQVKTLFNDQSLGSDKTYQSYDLAYHSYHKMSIPVVLAWKVEGCLKSGSAPLWDACKIGLRGFSATKYLGKSSASAQFEARWHISEKWGLVGFGGAGTIDDSFSQIHDREVIPSYGIGLRFMVLAGALIMLVRPTVMLSMCLSARLFESSTERHAWRHGLSSYALHFTSQCCFE